MAQPSEIELAKLIVLWPINLLYGFCQSGQLQARTRAMATAHPAAARETRLGRRGDSTSTSRTMGTLSLSLMILWACAFTWHYGFGEFDGSQGRGACGVDLDLARDMIGIAALNVHITLSLLISYSPHR